MPTAALVAYYDRLPALQAQYELIFARAAASPHLKKGEIRNYLTNLEKAAKGVTVKPLGITAMPRGKGVKVVKVGVRKHEPRISGT